MSNDTTLCTGAATNFTVIATGVAPLSYQWQKSTMDNGSRESGIINNLTDNSVYTGCLTSTLNIGDVTGLDSNKFRCIVSNVCGTDTSSETILTLKKTPIITIEPGNIAQCPGGSVEFYITATSITPLSYMWLKNRGRIGRRRKVFRL